MRYYMGIDGGGSTVRVGIADVQEPTRLLHAMEGESVNPSSTGESLARDRLRDAVRTLLAQAGLTPADVWACGVGVAGASAEHSEAWLRDTLAPVLPDVQLALASDVEIALIGANGTPYGTLVLAGTGSVALGIDQRGQRLQVGGWGYLLGDEGSGYALSMRALQHMAQTSDAGARSQLAQDVLTHFGWRTPKALMRWLYAQPSPPVSEVASFAPRLLALADEGEPTAQAIVTEGASALATLVAHVRRRLALPDSAPLGFAGSLLTQDTALSRALVQRLGLPSAPKPRSTPLVGALSLAAYAHPRPLST
jgi:N-acetylglucosamine kinase-like BadF-type ATPase